MLQIRSAVLHTQLREPGSLPTDHVWVPCLLTRRVEHEQIQPQTLLITHIEAIKHYQHDIRPLLAERIFCVGRHTAAQLSRMGFQRITHHDSAQEVGMVEHRIAPCAWLRGDRFRRDFSLHEGVRPVQTYRSYLNESAIAQIFLQDPREMHVYSDRVLQSLQRRSWPNTTLHHTAHCRVDVTLWRSTQQFDPNVAQEEF